jgi:hypothetical protein
LKTPFVFDALPFKSAVKPVISQGPYDVYVGALEEDKLPVYVIINRDTSVVEGTNEVIGVVKEWLNHFAPIEFTAQDLGQLDLGLVAKN